MAFYVLTLHIPNRVLLAPSWLPQWVRAECEVKCLTLGILNIDFPLCLQGGGAILHRFKIKHIWAALGGLDGILNAGGGRSGPKDSRNI